MREIVGVGFLIAFCVAVLWYILGIVICNELLERYGYQPKYMDLGRDGRHDYRLVTILGNDWLDFQIAVVWPVVWRRLRKSEYEDTVQLPLWGNWLISKLCAALRIK